VFDILSKLGEGSYGSVYKALHKESCQILAIKQVPVDTDLQDIIKEISIMQQCDSPYVVKYYGSYFKNTDLWVRCEDLCPKLEYYYTAPTENRLLWNIVVLGQCWTS
jgi:serine/threonine protein kinase